MVARIRNEGLQWLLNELVESIADLGEPAFSHRHFTDAAGVLHMIGAAPYDSS